MKSFLPPDGVEVFRFMAGRQLPAATDGIFDTASIPYKLSELSGGTVDVALSRLTDALTVLFTSIHTAGSPTNRILTQAFNDVVDLASNIRSGSGRPAALLARALYEHLVNYCTVEGNPEAAERYLASEAVGADLMLKNMDWLASNFDLPSAAPSRGQHAAVIARLASVLQDFGPQIRTKTFVRNLFERAKDAGFDEDYEGYRLLSQAVHGSAGGAEGLSLAYDEGPVVHRLGPSLRLAPLAYRWGFRWFRALIVELERGRPQLATSDTLQALDNVLACTADYFLATQQVDKDIQPMNQPRDPQVLGVVVIRRKGPRWYAFYPHLNMVLLAAQPEQGGKVLADLVQQVDSFRALHASAGRDISILTDLTVEPLGKAALPAHGLVAHDSRKNQYVFDFVRGRDGVWQWSGSITETGRKWGPGPGEALEDKWPVL